MSPKIPNLQRENGLYARGFRSVVGIDEVGRGAWAGPLVIGACILPATVRLDHLYDSKLLTRPKREAFAVVIRQKAVACGLGWATAQEIDALGLSAANKLAVQRALGELRVSFDYILADHMVLPALAVPAEKIVGGDQRCTSIAAASIIAKVARDQYMREQAAHFPHYVFEKNVGYPSPVHRASLRQHGPSAIHRRLFLRRFMQEQQLAAL